jgi:hypothetical protein
VLEADLGTHRKISTFRILRPLILAAAIVPIFMDKVATHGGGLTVELSGVRSHSVSAARTAVLPSPDHVLV